MVRQIRLYKRHFIDFMERLSEKERYKINQSMTHFCENNRIPHHYIKYIDSGIYEFRVSLGSNEFRIFFIYDGDTLVILFNGFRKKTQKTPRQEIEKAKRLKDEYYASKRD